MNAARGTTLFASMFGAAFALLGGILSLGMGSVSFGAPQHADTPREVVLELSPRAVPGERATARALRRETQSFDAASPRVRRPRATRSRAHTVAPAPQFVARAPVETPVERPTVDRQAPAREQHQSPTDHAPRSLPNPPAPTLPPLDEVAPDVPTLPQVDAPELPDLPELPPLPELPLLPRP